MPRFSVIVPAYQVQAYLHECLRSVLSQSYADLELIVVDDRSPDACGEIADEFAAADPRVLPVRLPEHTGPGGARAAGLERATGDYLLFLDGDDTLAPDALRTIADRLKETGEPDVLAFGHARVDWTGEPVRARDGGRLGERGPVPFALTDRPELLELPLDAGDKAYRREAVEHAALAAPTDLAWAYEALLTAETLATLDRVCVHRREHRHARKHAPQGLFDQYDRVFAFLAAHPGLAAWQPVLYRRMLDRLGAEAARLPRRAHAEFLRRARDCCRRHRGPGALSPRRALVRFGVHRTLRALRTTVAACRRTARLAGRMASALRTTTLRLHYGVQRRLPLRDRAVFTAVNGHGCNPAALEAAFRTHAPHLRTAWIARPEHQHTVPPGPRRLVPDSAGYWTALARSKYLVVNGDLDPRLVKRPGQTVVQTHRGTPLRHTGLDLLERPAAARGIDFGRQLRAVDQWDYVVSGNRHSTLTWERVHPGSYTTLEYGRPRNDVFQQATSADVARLRESLGVPRGAIAILYAPTHRDYRRTQRPALDLERLVRRLGPRFVVLARAHHRHGGPLARTVPGRIIDVTDHPNVQSLCLASDALVTDYGSLMFDYAGLDRPIVIHADDRAAYEAARGTYFDLRAFPPGAVSRNEDELIDIFGTGHWRGSRSAQLRAAFRERFCPYDDGRAAERVVRHVVLGQTDNASGLPPVVPVEGRHPVPSAAESSDRTPHASVPRPAAPLTPADSRH
ncbi:CDP-glycerol glycerophosphotransferase family protein [Streptomyces sp. NPDC088387]|uniref:bifunctional glycosyltransferase/CDP-glycerol:glycerophosphate glycerophosphotransferase n=1 Tax=Streptomyces sp. NPDC088387 TaxID=3365859 RepID=UPI0037F8A68B